MAAQHTGLDENGKRRVLELAGRALVRIRMLSQPDPAADQTHDQRLALIEKLADSAHNLPKLVATLGENSWATERTLSMECGLCESALREAAEF